MQERLYCMLFIVTCWILSVYIFGLFLIRFGPNLLRRQLEFQAWFNKHFIVDGIREGITSHVASEFWQMVTICRETQESKSNFRILEIGVGTGANFRYYPRRNSAILVENNPHYSSYCDESLSRSTHVNVERTITTENMRKLRDGTVDCVVSTYALCAVDNVDAVLREIKRVLRPGGCFLFVEPVSDPEDSWNFLLQILIYPLVKLYAGYDIKRSLRENIEDNFRDVRAHPFVLNTDQSFGFYPDVLFRPHIRGIAVKCDDEEVKTNIVRQKKNGRSRGPPLLKDKDFVCHKTVTLKNDTGDEAKALGESRQRESPRDQNIKKALAHTEDQESDGARSPDCELSTKSEETKSPDTEVPTTKEDLTNGENTVAETTSSNSNDDSPAVLTCAQTSDVLAAQRPEEQRKGAEQEETEQPTSDYDYYEYFIDKSYGNNLTFMRNIENGRFHSEILMDTRLKRLVVKKVIPVTIVSRKEFRSQWMCMDFVRENDHFVKMRGNYEIEDRESVIYTEYFEGCRLDILFTKLLITPPRLQNILRQLLEALSFMRNKGVLHCNIQGENILVNEDDKIKLAGFGRSVYALSDRERFGQPGYAAPEVVSQWFLKNRKLPSYPLDIYSVGATVFYHLFGKFPGYSSCTVLDKVVDQEIYAAFLNSGIPISEHGDYFPPGLDPVLEDLLRKLLEPNWTNRYTPYQALPHRYFSQAPQDMRTFFPTRLEITYELPGEEPAVDVGETFISTTGKEKRLSWYQEVQHENPPAVSTNQASKNDLPLEQGSQTKTEEKKLSRGDGPKIDFSSLQDTS